MNTENLPNVLTFIGVMGGFMLLVIVYWLPGMIADKRKHKDASAINVLNLLLGWTFIGWVVALVWSLTGNVREDK